MRQIRTSLLWLLITCLPAFAQTYIPLEEEAPATLLQAELGDAEIDFSLMGSWTASLTGSAGWLFGPGGVVYPQAFPTMEQGLFFSQVPDLTLEVRLMDQWFLQYSVLGSFEENSFLMGYEGLEGEFVRSVLLGNRDITMDPYRLLEIPAQGDGSLGATARFGGWPAAPGGVALAGVDGRGAPPAGDPAAGPSGAAAPTTSSHQLLVRYDNNDTGSRLYIGRNLVEETTVSLADFVTGRFFRLPDAGVEGLELYLEDRAGTVTDDEGRRYRAAALEDAVLDADGGRVALSRRIEGRVLVFYRKEGQEVGSTAASMGVGAVVALDGAGPLDPDLATLKFDWDLGRPGDPRGYPLSMADRRVELANGRACLRLWQPGEFSPFELQAAYPVNGTVPEDLSRVRIEVIEKARPERPLPAAEYGLSFRLAPGADTFTVYRSSDPADPANLYPFLDAGAGGDGRFDPQNLLYGPRRDPAPGYLRYELRVQTLTAVSDYQLEADVVRGSVRILRNGVAESRFTVDYESGRIVFHTYIHPDDRIEIEYRRRGELLYNGDFLLAWGNRLPLRGGLELELSAGLRWNALAGSFSERAYQRTGTALGTATLRGTGEHLDWSVSAGLTVTNPDTTGILRALGMERAGIELPLSDELAWPAAPPGSPPELVPPLDGAPLDGANRGRLIYKDYREYGAFGSVSLLPYDASPPPEQVFEYATGSRPGPYLAAGSSAGRSEGQTLVLDFEMDAGQSWVGFQVPLALNQGTADLSALRSISISYRALELSGDLALFLQIGDIGEDLDGDGVLDEELSSLEAGFSFDDDSNAPGLRVGGGPRGRGNGRRDTEDVDGNGFLDPEPEPGDPRVLTLLLDPITATAGTWRRQTIPLDAAQRASLSRVRGARLVLARLDSIGEAAGRVLIDGLTLSGGRFQAGGFPGQVIAREIDEREALDPPARRLEEVFPEVADIFHPSAELQKVLEIHWTGGAETDDWQVRGFIEAATEGIRYRRVVHYLRLPAVPSGDPSLEFFLEDADGRGITWRLDPAELPEGEWARVEAALEERRVYLNGRRLPEPANGVEVAAGYGSLARFGARMNDAGAEGSLYLDELHFQDPRSTVGGGLEADAELRLPGPLLTVGGYPLLGGLTLRERASAASTGFATLYGLPAPAASLTTLTELGVDLAFTEVDLDLRVLGSGDEITVSGGHRLRLPRGESPVIVTDAFRLQAGAAGRELYRENSLSLSAAEDASLEARSAAASRDRLLIQEWQAALAWTVPRPLSSALRLDLGQSADGFESAAFLPREGGYFSGWLESYRLLLPWPGGAPVERTGRLSEDWRLDTRPLGAALSAEVGFQSFGFEAGGRSQRHWLQAGLAFPLRLGGEPRGWTLTPAYRRRVELLTREAATGDLAVDAGSLFRRLGEQTCWYGQVPGLELFSAGTEQEFRERSAGLAEAAYLPEASLTLQRSFGSRLRDLFLPNRVELSVGKELRKKGDLLEFLNGYTLKAGTNAINLFGSYGAHPVFYFYNLDEIGSSLSATVRAAGSRPRSADLLWEHYVGFEGGREDTFSLDHRLQLSLPDSRLDEVPALRDTGEVRYRWRVIPPDGVRLPLLPPEVGEQGYFAHAESLELTLAGRGSADSWNPLRLVLKHETSLVLPEHGLIRAELSVGVDRERLPEGGFLSLGLKAGIEARIDF